MGRTVIMHHTKEHSTETEHQSGEYALIRDAEDLQLGMYDRPLPCFGCGIGWFSLLLGFVFPLMWYYATILYFGNYYHKDPRERAGLAASAIAVSTNLGIDVLFDVMVTFVAYEALNSLPLLFYFELSLLFNSRSLYFAGIDMYNCFDYHNTYSHLLVLATAFCIFTTALRCFLKQKVGQ
ncbi:hypothetical protein REPUB_Repub13aG0191100 [Reevesia pubescens]